jgi:hypothetical protein
VRILVVIRNFGFMLSFFDNIYYQLYLLTTSQDELKKRDWASLNLSVLQTLNALTIICLLMTYKQQFIGWGKPAIALVAISSIVFNYIRYQYSEKLNPIILAKKLAETSSRRMNTRKTAFSIYIFASIGMCIASMIFGYKMLH